MSKTRAAVSKLNRNIDWTFDTVPEGKYDENVCLKSGT